MQRTEKLKRVYIRTWGCQMNFHDSERMLGVLQKEGFVSVDDPKEADLVVFNTCSVREKAEQKFMSELGRLRHLKRSRPDVKIVVAGCVAQQKGEAIIERMPHVDCVLGPQNIGRIGETLVQSRAVLTEDNPDIAETDLPAIRKEGVSAWVNIMYGCNNFCSYCIVPYTRGRERSRPPESILVEIKELVSKGYKEVTLLGQNVNSYRGGISFPELLRLVNQIEGLERIRFVTSHPKDLGDDLIEAIATLDKVCEHIHLPLQSGSDRILGLMNRRYTYNDYLRKVEKLRSAVPGIAITTDIIAGFPTESEEDHRATINALKEIEFDGIFAFKFSPRPMTKAAEMEGQLPEELKGERLSEILQLQDEITEKKNRTLEGRVVEVLVEGPSETDKSKLTGRTRTNKIVNFYGDPINNIGRLLKVRITKGLRHSLEAIPI
jgi:tRNA-2-methylthio-N6-dimethylallyladenosine synthase